MSTATASVPTPPPHPGRFVRVRIIGANGLSVKEAAAKLGVHRVALSRFINEQAALSAEMAIRLEKAFGLDLGALMRMQNEYDIAQARQRFTSVQISPTPGTACAEDGFDGRFEARACGRPLADNGRKKLRQRSAYTGD